MVSLMPVASSAVPIVTLEAEAATIPTDAPEADGTIAWDATTIVVVEAAAGGRRGLGYTYSHASAAAVIHSVLAPVVVNLDAFDVERAYVAMRRAVRNIGRDGLAASAISAVDNALWDLKARLLGVPLVSLLGGVRDAIPAYFSGGFTSYDLATLCAQLEDWAGRGMGAVKMKIGPDPAIDRDRVAAAREAIGDEVDLFVDANGAYDRKVALAQARYFPEHRVTWFEEPVSSDDLEGLRLLRDRAPGGMEIAAGEYGYDIGYFRRMLDAGSVDVLQADATRCGGVTGFLKAAALADAWGLPLSAHTAPHLHAHLCCAASRARHVEYFHDHARIEALLFDGALEPVDGMLRPDRSRPGLGLELRRDEWNRLAAVTPHGHAR
jgi:L-alanine-DL-glutamate epimerase-like enolase superfamily enzyme